MDKPADRLMGKDEIDDGKVCGLRWCCALWLLACSFSGSGPGSARFVLWIKDPQFDYLRRLSTYVLAYVIHHPL